MKTVLVNPPQTALLQPRAYISLGLAYIGAVLEEADVEVEVLNLADGRLEERRLPEADWYGVSCTSATYAAVKRLVPALRMKGKVAVGGVHPSIKPRESMQNLKADVIVTGEGEYVFRDLVTGKTEINPIMNAGVIIDLDQLPPPARHLFNREDVVDKTGIHGQEKGVPATTVVTSRGCPYNCRFCCKGHPMLSLYRYRSADNVASELTEIKNDYGVEHIRFVDDEFTLHRGRTVKLMNKIMSYELTWVCITRADSLDKSLLKLMKEAGCVEVHVGVETGSDKLLKAMNKMTTAKTLLRGVKAIKDTGLRVKTYLMYDYPGETGRDREKTVEFMGEAKPDKFTLSRFVPLVGSEFSRFVLNGEQWFYPDEDQGFVEYRNRIREAIK